jgi:RNA polymerase sigma-B factor
MSPRDQLVADHLALAEYLARRFANRGEALDDLVEVALEGLGKAADRYDPLRAGEFSAYATQTIVAELKRHFADKGWAPGAPRRMQELYLRLSQIVDSLGRQLGRSPTIAELAADAKVSEEEVLAALEVGHAYSPALAGPAEDAGAGTRTGSVSQSRAPAGHESVSDALPTLVALFPEPQRLVVELRFVEGLAQSEIAHRLGLSPMEVSSLLARSTSRLRAANAPGTTD